MSARLIRPIRIVGKSFEEKDNEKKVSGENSLSERGVFLHGKMIAPGLPAGNWLQPPESANGVFRFWGRRWFKWQAVNFRGLFSKDFISAFSTSLNPLDP